MANDFSITTAAKKQARKNKVKEFVSKYGRGDKKLSISQKNARIEKILGKESDKIKGFGTDKTAGVSISSNTNIEKPVFIDGIGAVDMLSTEVKSRINDYPDDPHELSKTKINKLLHIKVFDDGVVQMSGIVNKNINNLKERSVWAECSASDKELANLEIHQKREGTLKEVSDRTMIIHEENGDLDELLEDPTIDTNEDKNKQY